MSPNIVIVGTLSEGDYKVTYPIHLSENYHNETGYQEACKKFYPAIDEADIVVVWGIPGLHTQRDIGYARSRGKKIVYLCTQKERGDDTMKCDIIFNCMKCYPKCCPGGYCVQALKEETQSKLASKGEDEK